MAAPKERKTFDFKENEYKFLKICSIGYNNSLDPKTGDFLCVNRWNALYFLRSGKAKVFIHGNTYNVKKGDMFFITPNEPWHIYPDAEDSLAYYWMALNADYAQEISEILGFSKENPVRAAKFPMRVEWIFDSLFEAKSTTLELYFTSLASLMQILSAEFAKIGMSGSTEHHRELAENIRQIIDLNFKNPEFSVSYAAQMLYIGHAQMSRVFKEVVGMTPVAYLVDVRLNFAAELLRKQTMSVKELCTASGFSDIGHFMKQFKKKFGLTVVEYRKQHNE